MDDDFEKILKAIDELIILNINKNNTSNVYDDIFCKHSVYLINYHIIFREKN
jgi:hypothetical protein